MTEVHDDVYVDRKSVMCDGGGGPLGHPRVYLAIGTSGEVECPYCSRRFIYRPETRAQATGTEPAEARAAC